MQKHLPRVVAIYLLSFSLVDIPIAKAGFDHFTVIDIFGDWIIEQKFDSETKQVFCRASLKGNGTWFAGKTRLNMNNELIVSEGSSSRDRPSLEDVRKVRVLLENCRKGLLYIPM